METKYYYNSISIFRRKPITYSNGEQGLTLERWNYDFLNWHGSINNHEKRIKEIETQTNNMREITEAQAKELIVGATATCYITGRINTATDKTFYSKY